MERYRRYTRWLKRIAVFLGVYVAVGFLFLGVSPRDALLHPGTVLATYRGFVVYLLFISMFLVVQFAAMFWFLMRGTYYTVYPNEYDKTFEDVRGQPAAVESSKEVLRLFQGFKDFKQMGGYPPHGILFRGAARNRQDPHGQGHRRRIERADPRGRREPLPEHVLRHREHEGPPDVLPRARDVRQVRRVRPVHRRAGRARGGPEARSRSNRPSTGTRRARTG
jgi:hypothetical protein